MCISFPLLSMFTHRRSHAAKFLPAWSVESFFNMHSNAVSFANMANSKASR